MNNLLQKINNILQRNTTSMYDGINGMRRTSVLKTQDFNKVVREIEIELKPQKQNEWKIWENYSSMMFEALTNQLKQFNLKIETKDENEQTYFRIIIMR